MKSLFIIACLLFSQICNAAWVFHSCETVNPWMNFTTDGTYNVVSDFEVITVEYGVDNFNGYTAFADQWVGQDITFDGIQWGLNQVVQVSGNTFTYSGSLLFNAVYIEGPFPDFLGGDTFTGLIEGEYWLDVVPGGGHGRISTSQPVDFCKYLWDGSLNPNYVAPLTKSKGHKKH